MSIAATNALLNSLTTPQQPTAPPSIFEISVLFQLRQSFWPAFEHIVKVVCQQNPAALAPLYRKRIEAFYFLMFFVQRNYLMNHDASVGEWLYGFHRRRTVSSGGLATASSLSDGDRALSLLYLVFVPFLHAKLSAAYHTLRDAQEASVDPTYVPEPGAASLLALPDLAKQLLMRVYPIVHAVSNGFGLFYQLLYAFKRSSFASPSLAAAGLRLLRTPPASAQDIANVAPEAGQGFWSKLFTGAKYAMIGTFVAIKVLEWYYSSEVQQQTSAKPRQLPPPPPPVLVGRSGGGICRICNEKRKNPAASSSGLVFCYTCLFRYVQDNQECPVTRLPCSVKQIRKLHLNEQ